MTLLVCTQGERKTPVYRTTGTCLNIPSGLTIEVNRSVVTALVLLTKLVLTEQGFPQEIAVLRVTVVRYLGLICFFTPGTIRGHPTAFVVTLAVQ